MYTTGLTYILDPTAEHCDNLLSLQEIKMQTNVLLKDKFLLGIKPETRGLQVGV